MDNIKEIPWEDIKISYRTDAHDGIVAGYCKYNNKIYYIDCWDFDYGGWDEPTEEELELIKKAEKKILGPTEEYNFTITQATIETLDGPIQFTNCSRRPDDWSGCRPRKFYIYEISKLNWIKEQISHYFFNLFVYKYSCSFGRYIYYTFITGTNKSSEEFRKIRTRYHKNKIIGWTKD